MEALVFLLTTPTIGAPPMVVPLPKALELEPVPVPLLKGLVLPAPPKGLVLPVLVEPGVLVGVPVLPDESEPVPVEDVLEVPEVDEIPPREGEAPPPRGFEVIPGVPPSTLLPAVPAFWIGWPKRPMAFTCASPKWMIFQSSLPVMGST